MGFQLAVWFLCVGIAGWVELFSGGLSSCGSFYFFDCSIHVIDVFRLERLLCEPVVLEFKFSRPGVDWVLGVLKVCFNCIMGVSGLRLVIQ